MVLVDHVDTRKLAPMQQNDHGRDFSRTVALAVATWRRRRGLTQAELAERLGLSNKMIAKVESGLHDMRLTTLYKLATALDASPVDLLSTQPEATDRPSVRVAGPLTGLRQTGWKKSDRHTANAIPVLDLRPRTNRGRPQLDPLAIAWAQSAEGGQPLPEGLFLAQIRGTSMQPQLRDGDWCLFSTRFSDTDWLGKLALLRETDASGLTAWIVKRVTGIELGDGDQRRLVLGSHNPEFAARQVTLDASGDVTLVAVVREVLTPPGPARRRA